MDSRFKRRSRLADKSSFSRVFENADRSRDKMFTVLYRPNGTNQPRLGLAIGKKHCRLATGRNRIKRIVRESFRQRKSEMPGLDIVVLNQPAATRATKRALFDSLETHWKKCRHPSADEAGKN
jgi:ribonuclease P protein component